jgi:hypothetical protein
MADLNSRRFISFLEFHLDLWILFLGNRLPIRSKFINPDEDYF